MVGVYQHEVSGNVAFQKNRLENCTRAHIRKHPFWISREQITEISSNSIIREEKFERFKKTVHIFIRSLKGLLFYNFSSFFFLY